MMDRSTLFAMAAVAALGAMASAKASANAMDAVEPLLVTYCYDCHGDGMDKGGVAFDRLPEASLEENRELWEKVLRLLRADIMPPHEKPQPSDEEKAEVVDWIKKSAFEIDPANPDPGEVALRRLNRQEYRNTVRDLMGVDFDTRSEFPADDSGHGFDNIADVLTVSPMLMEKYLDAAKEIVHEAVPLVSGVPAETRIPGSAFQPEEQVRDDSEPRGDDDEENGRRARRRGGDSVSQSYYEASRVTTRHTIEQPGQYRLTLHLRASERHVDNQFDYNKANLTFKIDDEIVLSKEFVREGGKPFAFEFDRQWAPGEHHLALEVEPLTPDEPKVRSLAFRIESVTVRGPMEPEHWVRPENHDRFFPGELPEEAEARRAYAAELLRRFAELAFRRPPEADSVDRLVDLAESTYGQPGATLEAGIAQAMTAILASPSFLFREESVLTEEAADRHPLIDEYALASRLSYFFWSSMPDDELMRLAGEGQLRRQLSAQVDRMLADARSRALVENFVGQWLQARDIESVNIDSRAVLRRERQRDPEAERRMERFRELRRLDEEDLTEDQRKELEDIREAFSRSFQRGRRVDFDGNLRRSMRRETEMLFDHILRQDRSLVELLDSDYAFLNETLAEHYGIEGLEGNDMRLVSLPAESPRGGILTQGTMLAVTSNPDRTSPVKRGVFILDHILGTPPAPPPPNIPSLEDAVDGSRARELTVAETLAIHRDQPLCASCHNRMDPLGLSLENFNAMGMWREQERQKPITVQGTLISGESFDSIAALKKVLANERREDFYRCFSEKLLTYALGRGLEYYDVHTVDTLVQKLAETDGRPSALIMGIVESAPFQKRRRKATEVLYQPEPEPHSERHPAASR